MNFGNRGEHETATGEVQEVASLYSLGLLEPELAAGFEQHLGVGCATCESELRDFNQAAAQMAYSLPESAPDPRVREALMKRIARPPVTAALVRANEGEWHPTPFAGVTVKRLFVDSTTGNVTSLVRMTGGSVYPSHRHVGLEHTFVLEGDVMFADHTLHAGDYEVASGSTDHAPITTRNGCLVLLVNNQRDHVLA